MSRGVIEVNLLVQEMPSEVWNDLRLDTYALSLKEEDEEESFIFHIYITTQ